MVAGRSDAKKRLCPAEPNSIGIQAPRLGGSGAEDELTAGSRSAGPTGGSHDDVGPGRHCRRWCSHWCTGAAAAALSPGMQPALLPHTAAAAAATPSAQPRSECVFGVVAYEDESQT